MDDTRQSVKDSNRIDQELQASITGFVGEMRARSARADDKNPEKGRKAASSFHREARGGRGRGTRQRGGGEMGVQSVGRGTPETEGRGRARGTNRRS